MKAGPLLCLATLIPLVGHAAPRLPVGFTAETLVEGIDGATALTIAPDGRIFYAEQTGAIRIVENDRLLPDPALDLSARLDTWWERGLIGLTLHPDFPHSPFLYTVYVAKEPFTHHVVSRFTVVGNRIDPRSELVLLEADDQSKLGGKVPAGHQGGPLCFGADGLLYIGLGEQTAGMPSQSLATLQGKILRIRPDGRIPEDNPFFTRTEGKYRAIYAIGIRNPFGLAADPESGRLLETDVGGSAFEEINEIVAGGNYGWPLAEGMSPKKGLRNPLHAYPPAIGRSICGAMFYPRGGDFPEKWHGKFFFVDWASHWIKALDLSTPAKLIPFAEGFAAPVGIAAAPDGSICVLNRNTRWRDGKKYKEKAGSLVRIRYTKGKSEAPRQPGPPTTLLATGCFESLEPLVPAKGFHAFELNAPVWLPAVTTRRWIRLPGGKQIETTSPDAWRFPIGTAIVIHFDGLQGNPHETHVLEATKMGRFACAAYRWNDAGTNATLITGAEIRPTTGSPEVPWFSPGPAPSLDPALALVGFRPQFDAAQLNRGAQLRAWRQRGWLPKSFTDSQIVGLPRLADLEDKEASLGHRARSYLDANCAICHQPGGPSRGLFDIRLETQFAEQNLLNAEPVAGDLGIAGGKLIVPGSPEKSILYQRMRRHDPSRMPPVTVHNEKSPALPVIEEWIRGLEKQSVPPAPGPAGSLKFEPDAIDKSAGGLRAYRITTPTAVFYLEKSGAGLSSLLDQDGNDWLSFHPQRGSGAEGEYRGFPNAVFKEGGSYFHPRNGGTDPADTRVVRNNPEGITITARGQSGAWACRYDFTTTHCTFTMTGMPPGRKYWALYEGTPGGSYHHHDWWMTSAIQRKQPLTRKHEGDIPGPEWIAFGDRSRKRALLLVHHEDDHHPDTFYQMQGRMTVFGFGRRGMQKFLASVPQSISIALVESDDHAELHAAATRILADAPSD